MATNYISCADTAKLIRAALKEAFPGIKFSVKSHTYSGGASINVRWTDGPNTAQVEAVAGTFSGSYFDGGIDYKGATYAMIDGISTRFGADFIFCNRDHSDAAIQRAIDRVAREYAGNFTATQTPVPTVADFRGGKLFHASIMPRGDVGYWSLQSLIHRQASKNSDRLAVNKSKTAGKVIYLGNDGYGQRGALSV